MNFMGIGFLELVVILLVAFLVLGPSRSIGMARSAGKVLGDLKRTFSEVAAAASFEETERTGARRESASPSRQEFTPTDPPAPTPGSQEEPLSPNPVPFEPNPSNLPESSAEGQTGRPRRAGNE